MRLAKFRSGQSPLAVGLLEKESILPLDLARGGFTTLADLLEADDIGTAAQACRDASAVPHPLADVALLPPIDQQEVWAAGVTYKRSKAARMEESEASATCYDRVYVSPRPELFFKATPHRVAGSEQPLRIRRDATWNVPEPELTVVINSRHEIVGYTVGNDMSSRDIEGENPLYLPQAKVYDACCGLGPCITLAAAMLPLDQIEISMAVRRGGQVAFEGRTDTGRLARSPQELVDWLTRELSFPHGAFLLTGTGIVPDSDFSLAVGDVVEIAIAGIGTLRNRIERGPDIGDNDSFQQNARAGATG